jgi:hypothetical protein
MSNGPRCSAEIVAHRAASTTPSISRKLFWKIAFRLATPPAPARHLAPRSRSGQADFRMNRVEFELAVKSAIHN